MKDSLSVVRDNPVPVEQNQAFCSLTSSQRALVAKYWWQSRVLARNCVSDTFYAKRYFSTPPPHRPCSDI